MCASLDLAMKRCRCAPKLNSLLDPVQSAGILWRPDGQGDARTFEQVMVLLNKIKEPVPIWVNQAGSPDYIVPPTSTPYPMHGSWFQAPPGAPQSQIVVAQDGAQFLDLSRIMGGMILNGKNNTKALLTFTPLPGGVPSVFLSALAAQLVNDGVFPMIDVNPGGFFVWGALFGGGSSGLSGNPIIRLGLAANMIWSTAVGATLAPNSIVGAAPSNVIVQNDGSIDYFNTIATQSTFTGNFFNSPDGKEGGAGPTSWRPQAAFSPLVVGVHYYDTDLAPKIPIYWDGAQWNNALGAGPV